MSTVQITTSKVGYRRTFTFPDRRRMVEEVLAALLPEQPRPNGSRWRQFRLRRAFARSPFLGAPGGNAWLVRMGEKSWTASIVFFRDITDAPAAGRVDLVCGRMLQDTGPSGRSDS